MHKNWLNGFWLSSYIIMKILWGLSESYNLRPFQTSMMEYFCKNSSQLLAVSYFVDVWQAPKHVSERPLKALIKLSEANQMPFNQL